MIFQNKVSLLAIPFMVICVQAQGSTGKKKLDTTMKSQKAVQVEAANSQKKINSLDDETHKYLNEFRMTLQKIENMKIYNQQLKVLIASQRDEIVSTKNQIEQVKDTGKDIVPLMLRMLENLEKFVALDLPFLPEERSLRIKQLKKMMDRADVSTSEKFRRLLEAYQVENDYGRTIEAYRGIQKVQGADLTVDFLRIGRVSLIFQTLDGNTSASWNHKQKKWIDLDSSYEKSIKKGLRIARKQAPPDLLELPIPAPEVTQ